MCSTRTYGRRLRRLGVALAAALENVVDRLDERPTCEQAALYPFAMELNLRAELYLGEHTNLALDGFLPLASDPRFFQLADTGLAAALVMDPEKHRGWLDDLDVQNVEKHYGLRVTGLWILLNVDVDDELATAIAGSAHTAETEEFGQKVLDAIHLIHDSIEDFARNEHHQYWLPTRRESSASLQQQLMSYDTRFRIPAGWKLLDVAPNEVMITVGVSRGIDIDDWTRFQQRLSQGRLRTLTHRRFVANAFALHDRGDLRAAVVEAVAAWETAVNTQAPALFAQRGIGFDEGGWKKFIDQAGLRASTRLLFALLPDITELVQVRDPVLRALDLRNNIVHNGQRRVDDEQAREALRAIRAAITACEGEQAIPQDLPWKGK